MNNEAEICYVYFSATAHKLNLWFNGSVFINHCHGEGLINTGVEGASYLRPHFGK